MTKLLWYYGRLVAWMTVMLLPGNAPEAVVAAIKIDLERAKHANICSIDELALHLGILMSWAESIEEGLPPPERVKIGKLLEEIRQLQKEFFQ